MANPLQEKLNKTRAYQQQSSRPLTIDDVFIKVGTTLGVVAVVGVVSFFLAMSGMVSSLLLVIVGGLVALGISIYATVKKKLNSAKVALSFAFFEGLFVGGATFLIAYQTNAGNVIGSTAIVGAISATLGIAVLMLVLYKTKIIKVTAKFQMVIAMITLGILVASLIGFGLSLLGIGAGLRTATPLGLLFSLFCIVIASLNYASDFKYINDLIDSKADVECGWGAAFIITSTTVWLYVEILRFIVNLASFVNR